MAKKAWVRTLLFLVCLFLLALISFKLGESLFQGRELREPAALKRSLYDYSNLPESSFHKKVKEHLLKTVRIERSGNSLVLFLNNFLGPSRPVSVCSTYNQIIFELTAEGVASSGDVPKMRLTMPCEPSHDEEYLESLVVDIRKLVQKDASDQSFAYSEEIEINMLNFPGLWPTEWFLSALYLKNQTEEIGISGSDLDAIPLAARSVRW
jgi:hypothetical protein